ncbi:MAG: membrane-bound PQQ-dependent dehydrogenase, glucose/quinate/shikimate family, partial [Brevundimonas sp.]|nr:membrane-bound PQQ-dependent dehydrogenase, glucose/quinate/shikimate family [Brevundimonas sp.]
MARSHSGRGPGAVFVRIFAVLVALLGVPLVLGGGYLIALGGSFYYLLAGLGLIASGILMARLKPVGAWIYIAVFLLTVLWALWEVGLNGWALVPRIVAPAVLLVGVILSLPVLLERGGGRLAAVGGGVFAVATVVFAMIVGQANRAEAPAQMAGGPLPGVASETAGADWPAYGGTHGAQRYSALTQINRENVAQLERAWTYRTGDLPEEKWGAETTPLKIGDSLYLCSARNVLIALDARTGQQRWRYDPQGSDDWI